MSPFAFMLLVAAAQPGQLAGTPDHACWLRAGEVSCFGTPSWGHAARLPPKAFEVAEPVPGLSGVVSLGAGKHHLCALDGEARVWCWGAKTPFGMRESTADGGAGQWFTTSPVEVAGFRGATHLFVGPSSTCALFGGKRAPVCWLNFDSPSLGLGPFGPSETLAQHESTLCAAKGGTLKCNGYLADVSGLPHPRLLVDSRPDPIRSLAVGFGYACALTDKGVSCLKSDPGKPKGKLAWREVAWPPRVEKP